MRDESLNAVELDAIGEVDDRLIDKAAGPKRRSPLIYGAALAACLALVLTVPAFFSMFRCGSKGPDKSESSTSFVYYVENSAVSAEAIDRPDTVQQLIDFWAQRNELPPIEIAVSTEQQDDRLVCTLTLKEPLPKEDEDLLLEALRRTVAEYLHIDLENCKTAEEILASAAVQEQLQYLGLTVSVQQTDTACTLTLSGDFLQSEEFLKLRARFTEP